MTALRVLLVATAGLASTAGIAVAQQTVPDTGGRVYGLVGGGFGDGTFATTGAGAGLRLNSHLGLDLELSHLSGRTIDGTTTSWFDDVFSTLATSTASTPARTTTPRGFLPSASRPTAETSPRS